MTYEEALELLNNVEFAEQYQGKDEYTEMLLKCKEALEKQTAKKPVKGDCPICGNPVQFWSCGDVKSDYCDSCGQALNWE